MLAMLHTDIMLVDQGCKCDIKDILKRYIEEIIVDGCSALGPTLEEDIHIKTPPERTRVTVS